MNELANPSITARGTMPSAIEYVSGIKVENIRPLRRAEQNIWSRWHAGLPGWAVIGFKEIHGSLFGIIPGGRVDD